MAKDWTHNFSLPGFSQKTKKRTPNFDTLLRVLISYLCYKLFGLLWFANIKMAITCFKAVELVGWLFGFSCSFFVKYLWCWGFHGYSFWFYEILILMFGFSCVLVVTIMMIKFISLAILLSTNTNLNVYFVFARLVDFSHLLNQNKKYPSFLSL